MTEKGALISWKCSLDVDDVLHSGDENLWQPAAASSCASPIHEY